MKSLRLSPVLLALALSFRASTGQAADLPKAFAPSESYDFGGVKQGDKVSHCFKLENQGSAPLKTTQMALSLPDMTARGPKSIPAGGTGQVCVELGTSTLNLKVRAQTLLFTNDPSRPRIPLVMTGTVHAPIDLLPMGAVLASVWKGDGGESTVTIVNNRSKPLHVHGIETKGRHFTARLETEKPGQVYKLVVMVPASLAPGLYRGTVFVNTDAARYRRIRVPVNILVKNEIYTFPLNLKFGSISLEQVNSGQISAADLSVWFLVKKRSGKFRIKSIASANPALEITQTPKGESNTFRVNVTVRKGHLEPGPLSSVIDVQTDDPAVPEVSVPVTGQITN